MTQNISYPRNWAKRSIAPANSTGEPIYIPNFVDSVTIGIVDNNSGAGKVQYTISPVEDIQNPLSTVYWNDWPAGPIQNGIDGLNFPVVAVRLVSIGSTSKIMEVCGSNK